MYIEYEEYKSLYGGRLSLEEFNSAEPKAEAYLKYLTYINGDIFAKPDERVKLALCSAVEVVAQAEQEAGEQKAGTAGIKSESNDGYSVTYITDAQEGMTFDQAVRRRVYESIRTYLLPTGWLRRRVGRC